jgi:hypothetical protein
LDEGYTFDLVEAAISSSFDELLDVQHEMRSILLSFPRQPRRIFINPSSRQKKRSNFI